MSTSSISPAQILDFTEHIATLNLGYLGISVTIIIFIGGAFYLFNFRPLKETLEKQEAALKDLDAQVRDNLTESKNEIKNDLVTFTKEQSNETKTLLEQEKEKIIAEIDKKVVTFEKDFSKNFELAADKKDESLKGVILAEVSNRIREVEKTILAKIDENHKSGQQKIEAVEKSIATLKSFHKETKRKTRELEVFMYSQKGMMGAILGNIDLLKEDIDEDSWRIEGTLEDLSNEMEGITLKGEVITRIEEQLVRLDDKPKYAPLVEQVRSHYKKE